METCGDLVISGLSGRFPESENSEIFWQHLIRGKDMVSDNPRWDAEAFETPRRAGKIPLIEKFDANFFGVSGTQANKMDPKIRIALEVVYEAVIDAGIHPKSISGSRVGVFMASSGNDAADIWLRSTENRTGHYITGCYPCMLADRISYAFNLKGPTCVVDTGCSASFSAIQYAILALKNGLCDSAIVGGANINTFPFLSSAFFKFNALSSDGKCKAFDASADGFVRSEAVVAFYICRKACAKRIYATIIGIKCTNDGYKEDGISVPSSEIQAQIIKEVYAEAGVSPLDVAYVEAHGTGTTAGDPKEIAALADAFCKGRREPLLVGSVKSNMGHAELASGLCGIVKVLLARRFEVIPPNLHFKTPNPECEALIKGIIKIVVDATPFQGQFVGVNSFGIGGTTGHAILKFEDIISKPTVKGHQKPKTLNLPPLKYTSSIYIPTLLLASGQTNKAVEHFLDKAAKSFEDTDFVGLLHQIAGVHTSKHRFAGFSIINQKREIETSMCARSDNPPQMWYVYTGLGSQWVGMANEMRKFKTFNNSVLLSAQLLRKVDVDLEDIFMSEDKSRINSLQNAFVTITACQIALTDLLDSLDIFPNTMTGQSLGEVTCGYADGCLTRGQALLSSYFRARAFMESSIPPGAMATTGLTWEEAQTRCPLDIFPAIHSAENNVTISGPNESIKKFVELLTNEGVFAKEVTSAMQAYHSPYVRNSEQLMLTMLKSAIAENKRRSKKWLSSSVPTINWESGLSQYCSAEYLVNNAMSPVLLHQVFQFMPHNALVVEIGAHCFLQTVLKQSLAASVSVLGLMHWSHDNTKYFLSAIGKIFLAGFQVKCSSLYEPLKFPVPLETPSLSPLIKWDHTKSWEVPLFKNERSLNQGLRFVINLSSDEFLTGHAIDEKIVFPATGYIYLVWKAFAKLQYKPYVDTSVVLENIIFKRMTTLPPNQDIEFIINVLPDCGIFEIFENSEIVCSGTIDIAYKEDQEMISNTPMDINEENVIDHDDFYKLLVLKGYEYQGVFRGVQNIETDGMWARLAWNDNWIGFLDTMLQTCILHTSLSLNELVVPIRLDSATIFPKMFKESLKNGFAIVTHCMLSDTVECPGLRLCGLKLASIGAITPLIEPTISVQKFCAYINNETESLDTTLQIFVGIILDNIDNSDIMDTEAFVFTEVTDCCQTVDLNLQLLTFFKFKLYEHRIVQTTNHKSCNSDCISKKCKVFPSILDTKILPPSNIIYTIEDSNIYSYMDLLADNGFIIITTNNAIPLDLALIAKRRTEKGWVCLLKRKPCLMLKPVFISLDLPDFGWVDNLKQECVSAHNGHRIHIISRSFSSGIIGFTKCVLKELEWPKIRCVHINEEANVCTALEIEDILKNDLVFNIYISGSWGTYANIRINELEKTRNTDCAHMEIKTVGDFTSICWVESPIKLHQRSDYEIHFSGLNFRDIMFATGKIPRNAFAAQGNAGCIGFEFSGTYRNKRVFGVSDANCLATALGFKPQLVWDVPDNWSLAEAVTVPAVYITVLHSFFIRAKLKEGESVLIHSGSGGVGLAAITIALDLKCTVYTTVGSNAKREFLKTMFPKLHEEQILDSNNGNKFKKGILKHTKGKGVDVVLNSLSQDKLKASLECLGKRGRFLEIGKLDSFNNTSIGLAVLLRSVDIQGITLDEVVQSHDACHLQQLVQNYLNEGKLKPLPFKCFSHDQLREAFAYFASRKHVGKVIIEVRGPSGKANIAALPRTYFVPYKTYIIIGGLGGMGLEIVTWMIQRGARKIFVVSRSGVSTSYQKYMLKGWTKCGATIFHKNTNISSKSDVSKLIQEAILVGPLGGVFNLAIVLQDALFVNQTPTSFEMASKCKAIATTIFDAQSRKYAPKMDYFVIFSSIVCGRGNAGQSNYGYANSVMERICEQRKLDGFSALAIQWGPVADVGSVGKIFRRTRLVEGYIGQTISSCIATLDLLLQQNETVVSSFVLPLETQNYSGKSKCVLLSQNVAKILGISDLENININDTLTEHGMDSIMSAQIKHSIQRKNPNFIPISGYGSLTFSDLKLMD